MTTSHENCYHPKTKSARAACRRQAEALRLKNRKRAEEIIEGYYSNEWDNEMFAYAVVDLAVATKNPKLLEARDGYYDNSLTLEQMANLLYSAKFDL